MSQEPRRTRGQVEAAVGAALTQFERDWLGRGPQECRVAIVADAVLVRLKGVLSPGEQELARQPGGVALIKEMRTRLIEGARDSLARLVEQHTGVRVVSMHTDLSIPRGERAFVFVLEADLETRIAT